VTPQPMSDAEIIAVLKAMPHRVNIEQWGNSKDIARSILAARDAQWVAMPGEPVGEVRDCVWRGMSWSVSILAPTKLDLRTPLYAIKETP
jgi:hypothetical protein